MGSAVKKVFGGVSGLLDPLGLTGNRNQMQQAAPAQAAPVIPATAPAAPVSNASLGTEAETQAEAQARANRRGKRGVTINRVSGGGSGLNV